LEVRVEGLDCSQLIFRVVHYTLISASDRFRWPMSWD